MALVLPADRRSFGQIEQFLQQDEIVALPMATVYGLVAKGTSPAAVAKLRAIKHLPAPQPLTILTNSVAHAETVAALTPAARQMLSHFPYPVTMIVPAKPHLDPLITDGFASVFLACPDAFIAELVQALPFFLVALSAQVGETVFTTFTDVQRYFGSQVAVIVDGGSCHYRHRSTLVDFTVPQPTILTYGAVSVDDLRPILPEVVLPSHLMK
ncbi:MAG: L-threonylcarbamoyladenylate synthase [Gloeomargarita sp. SKYG116]|nr:L-threonylcarbamoyladenylate synthase [Gloeomargarita sp. SKYG116]MDW8400223.1 L-threonylcarbamoyladenylate synthase [Gloeomargarita sp. SKYGB_i_bin116]